MSTAPPQIYLSPLRSLIRQTFTRPASMENTDPNLDSNPLPAPAPRNDKRLIQVTVGMAPAVTSSRNYPRTFSVRYSLLAKHSTLFRDLPATEAHVSLRKHLPQIFQEFLDYANSFIYSPSRLSSHRPIRQHILAWLLGQELDAQDFQDAALRALYQLLEPLAHDPRSNADRSPIKARDVDFVCQNTEPGSSLRRLLFDATMSHWSRFEGNNIDLVDRIDTDGEDLTLEHDEDRDVVIVKVGWSMVHDRYEDFRAALEASRSFGNRANCLMDMEEYTGDKLGVRRDDRRGRSRNRVVVVSSPARPPLRRGSASVVERLESAAEEEEDERRAREEREEAIREEAERFQDAMAEYEERDVINQAWSPSDPIMDIMSRVTYGNFQADDQEDDGGAVIDISLE